MSDRLRWLRRLVQGPGPQPVSHPGKPAHLGGVEAAVVVERRAGATLYDSAAVAVGAARGGTRATAMVDLATTSDLQRVLADAVRGLVPLVIHAVGDPDDIGPVGSGAFILAPRSATEAVDLTVVARWLTERALVPGIVLHRDDAAGDVQLPSSKDLAAVLGGPADPLPCPTDGQRLLFGDTRPTVVPWFDLDHPMGAGQPRPAGERAVASTARGLWFGDELPQLLTQALATWSTYTGRELEELTVHGPAKADAVVVASGELAERALLHLSDEAHVAVVAVTSLHPLPVEALRSAISKARRVIVLERATDGGRLRGLIEAVAGSERCHALVVPPGAPDVDPEALAALCRGGTPPTHRPSASLPRRQVVVDAVLAARPELWVAASGSEVTVAGGGLAAVPAIVRRIATARPTPDSLPRFWGEQLQPRLAGTMDAVPDPARGAGVVPAGASALLPGPAEAPLPMLSAAACTACGICWTVCPDGAIGASILEPRALLDGAASSAGRNDHTDALKRGHKALAKHLTKGAKATGARVLQPDAITEGATWLAGRIDVPAEAFEGTAAALSTLEPMWTPRLCHDSGDALAAVIAIDPRACQGCGLCAVECPEQALVMAAPRSEELAAAAHARWQRWEALPDTGADTVERLGADKAVGPVAAWLASRHGATSLVGGGGAPGSGERLALRMVVAVVERELQRAYAGLSTKLAEASLDAHQESLTSGVDGLGRARFGVVIAGRALASRLAAWPSHPVWAPLTVEHEALAVDTALGLADAAVRRHVAMTRDLRQAKGALTWADLTPDERASCPPILVLVDDLALSHGGMGAWSRALSTDLPVKIVFLDSLQHRAAGTDPGLLALAHRTAAVAAVSPADPTHLAEAVAASLAWSGPALLHVHSPHTEAPDGAMSAARDALARCEHLLVRYDPTADGVFGTRVTLGQVPDSEAVTPAEIGPARAEVVSLWRELAGEVSPFVTEVRTRVEAEVAAERQGQLEALEATHAATVAALRAEIEGEAVDRLTERLMTLAGYSQPGKR